jgi:hypothetical protein
MEKETMPEIAQQLESLRRIAEFSARTRGHQLAGWKNSQYSSTAVCDKCGRAVTVHVSLFEPDIEGAALSAECDAIAAEAA